MATVAPSTYPVTFYDGPDANGVATIVGTLLSQNFESFPERIAVARRMARPVTIVSTDTDTACTIVFNRDGASVFNDLVGRPAVTVIATVDQILDVSQLPMKAGGLLPVGFLTNRGVHVLKEILTRRLIVKGLLTHTVSALRTIALVSVVQG
jgi:hypothetical protein